MIYSLSHFENFDTILEKSNDRDIKIYKFEDLIVSSESIYYPNIVFYLENQDKHFNPVNEKTMSLVDSVSKIPYSTPKNPIEAYKDNLFFFVYNTDNYYHFVYDTLPYLISFQFLRKSITDLKLLMSYPNKNQKENYKFVKEFLSLLGINESDIIFISKDVRYENIFVSTSFTHDGKSESKPHNAIYSFFDSIRKKIDNNIDKTNLPKKIYISRRTWKHNNLDNIGTNYTTRRKLLNEDILVDYLESKGFVEVFTETMSTIEKLILFNNCDIVVGCIGGGLCNVLFANENTKLICLVSPSFLDVNDRFRFSFERIPTTYFHDTYHADNGEFKNWMRVRCGDIIGEISEIDGELLTIQYVDENVSGWNNNLETKILQVSKVDCIKLDNGLNSPWLVDLEEFKKISID